MTLTLAPQGYLPVFLDPNYAPASIPAFWPDYATAANTAYPSGFPFPAWRYPAGVSIELYSKTVGAAANPLVIQWTAEDVLAYTPAGVLWNQVIPSVPEQTQILLPGASSPIGWYRWSWDTTQLAGSPPVQWVRFTWTEGSVAGSIRGGFGFRRGA